MKRTARSPIAPFASLLAPLFLSSFVLAPSVLIAMDDDENDRDRSESKANRDTDAKKELDGDRPSPRRPDGNGEELSDKLAGFSGQIGGIVESKGDGPSLIIRVVKVHKVWKNNKAKEPKSLEGKTIRVGPGSWKDDSGEWKKAPIHVAFIKAFPAKDDLRLEIRNREGNSFHILELSERQRELARSHDDNDDGG